MVDPELLAVGAASGHGKVDGAPACGWSDISRAFSSSPLELARIRLRRHKSSAASKSTSKRSPAIEPITMPAIVPPDNP